MINWTKAPEWANYAAMDGKNGKWWWTADRPEHLNNCWDKGVCASMDKPYPTYDGDWKDSLQERTTIKSLEEIDGPRVGGPLPVWKPSGPPIPITDLRDQFAMAILTGLCSNPNLISMNDMVEIADGIKGGKHIIGAAKVLADAIMEARK